MSELMFPGAAPHAGGGPDNADNLIVETTTQRFRADVIDASMEVPVLVDFWAPWCGPCRQLTPTLEKAVRAAKGRVKLAKMNIDEHPEIAGQLQVQSIPTVYVFSKGQPVDGFMGAVPESQIMALIERVAGPAQPSDEDTLIEEADRLLAEGALGEAAGLYSQVFQANGQNAAAIAGVAQCMIRTGDYDRARQTLALTPPDGQDHPAIVAARTALELAEAADSLGDPVALTARLESNPNDHQARYDLAQILHARGENVAATDALIHIVKADREWSDGAARKLLLQFFEAWGPQSDLTKDGRRKLSAVLFS